MKVLCSCNKPIFKKQWATSKNLLSRGNFKNVKKAASLKVKSFLYTEATGSSVKDLSFGVRLWFNPSSAIYHL